MNKIVKINYPISFVILRDLFYKTVSVSGLGSGLEKSIKKSHTLNGKTLHSKHGNAKNGNGIRNIQKNFKIQKFKNFFQKTKFFIFCFV